MANIRGEAKGRSPHYTRLHRLRNTVQVLALLGFFYLFIRTAAVGSPSVGGFLRLDPLLPLTTGIATWGVARKALWSLALIGLTVLLGRFFCGWVCPLGTSLDVARRLCPPKQQPNKPAHLKYQPLKYYLLCFVIVAALFGLSFMVLLDPLVLVTRTMTLTAFPPAVWVLNRVLSVVRPVASRLGLLSLAYKTYHQPVMTAGMLSLILLVGILALERIERRSWCRYLCPLGALLSLVSALGRVRRHVSAACTKCALCEQSCPMGAIQEGFSTTSTRECILCLQCAAVCPVQAIRFAPNAPSSQADRTWNTSRRAFLFAAAAGVGTAAVAAASPSQTRSARLIRPPGSLPEADFLDRCVRCGACMKACATNGLQPALLEAGLEGIWTARLVPRIGACEQYCNLCGTVCPTGAIRDLSLEEKQYAKMGTAVISRERCIAWQEAKLCLVCDEVCPYDAVEFRMITDHNGTLQRPFVLKGRCTGCGLCEYHCPVDGHAAIYVERSGEERRRRGSYITPQKKRLRRFRDDRATDYFKEFARPSQPLEMPEEQPVEGLGLPPGFLPE